MPLQIRSARAFFISRIIPTGWCRCVDKPYMVVQPIKAEKDFAEGLCGEPFGYFSGWFSQKFSKILSSSLYAKKAAFLDPCLAKKFSLSLYGDFDTVLDPLFVKNILFISTGKRKVFCRGVFLK